MDPINQNNWDELLKQSPIIAAVTNSAALQYALESPVKIIYLLFGTPMNIGEMLKSIRDRGKLPLTNLDLLQGFSRDAYAVEYLSNCGTAGIISTRNETLRAARSQELITVLRTFMIDSAAVEAARRSLEHFQPDAIELLPAITAPLVLNRVRENRPTLRVIAGGLVSELKHVENLIAAGVNAVSLSDHRLWIL